MSIGSPPEARVAATSSDYGPWAREVCDVLERSLVQLQTVSVSPDDLGAFFRTAATNAEDLAEELSQIEAPPGTDDFMAQAVAAFRATVPLLIETGEAIDAAGPDATLEGLRREVAAREPGINAELTKVHESARADLPAEAQRALSQSLPCGLVGRP